MGKKFGQNEGHAKHKIDPKQYEKTNPRPKRPLSAFFIYKKQKFPDIKEKFPHLEVPEISQILSEMWKNESEATKTAIREQFEKENKEYKKQLAKYKYENRGKPANTKK